MVHPLSKPAREEADLKHRIADAATRLFAERGYAAVSVRAICEAAGTTKPMVYYYFDSKEGLYRALVAAAFDGPFLLLEQAAREDWPLVRTLEAFARLQVEGAARDPEKGRLVFAAVHGPPEGAPAEELRRYRHRNLGRLAERFAAARERGEVGEIPPTDLAYDFVGMVVMAVARRLEPGDTDPLPPAERATQLVRRFLDGAAGPLVSDPCDSPRSSA